MSRPITTSTTQSEFPTSVHNDTDDATASLTGTLTTCVSRGTICSKPVSSHDNFIPPVHGTKTQEDMDFLQSVMNDCFLFMELTSKERQYFIRALQYEEYLDGENTPAVLIRQGDRGDFCYIVQEGIVNFVNDREGGAVVGSCTVGATFGELALLYDSPRAVSCIQASKVLKVWKMDQTTFRHILAHHTESQCQQIKDLLRKVSLFQTMKEQDVIRFVKNMVVVHWNEGDRIVQKGQEGTVFYIIQEGQVRVHDIGLGDSQFQDQILEPGQAFGERSLLTGEPRAANVTALTDVTTLAMDRDTFTASIGPMKDILEKDMRRKVLQSLPLFANSNITDPELDHLVDLTMEVCYCRGQKLVEAGHPYNNQLWIIRHGKLLVFSSKNPDEIYNLQSGDYFGEKSISKEPGHVSSHTAVCEDNLTTWVLNRSDIESVIGDIDRLGDTPSYRRSSRNGDSCILLSDLVKHRMLGMGAFGKVWLVSVPDKKEAFALKVVSKRKLISSHQVHSVKREKELLCLLDHPFILHMVSSFQDEFNLYLLLPVIPGGELFKRLQKRRSKKTGMPTAEAAFYSACIIEALGHFHQRHVAYRDLKLENVLIDEDGYCKIADLGFAKVVTDKTYTLVGTPEYLAPEIIMSKGHDKAVDYWAYGILTFELLVGRSPFYEKGLGQMDMFKRIVLVKYEMPDFLDDSAKSLITRLLVRQQAKRLGNLANGYVDIKTHTWFRAQEVDFKDILKKEAEAPWKPDLKDHFDASSHFDDYGSKEKEIDYGKKLTKDEQDLFLDF